MSAEADPAADIAVVEAIYAAMAERDVVALVGLIDPTIVVTQDERIPWGGRFEGHDGFATFAFGLLDAITSAVDTLAMFSADGDVFQYGRTQGTVNATGAPFDVAEVHRWTIRDGKAVRAHFSIDVAAMLAVLDA